jgi:hypothetical protein
MLVSLIKILLEGGFFEMAEIKVLDCGIDMEKMAGPTMACCSVIAITFR